MTDKTHLTDTEINLTLSNLNPKLNWTHDQEKNALAFSYQFKNFSACFAMMTRIAFIAEKQNHHPDWFNSYNRLKLRLTSHDCGGITLRDQKMAISINKLFDSI